MHVSLGRGLGKYKIPHAEERILQAYHGQNEKAFTLNVQEVWALDDPVFVRQRHWVDYYSSSIMYWAAWVSRPGPYCFKGFRRA